MVKKPKSIQPELPEIPKPNREHYNDVVASAKLVAIQLAKSRFDVSPEFYDSDLKKKLGFDHSDISTTFDRDENIVIGRFGFGCEAKGGRKSLLKATAEYIVIYEVHEGANGDAVEAFCARVGVFAAYPYFRALVANLAWAANAKLPPLPVIATKGSPIKAMSDPGSSD